MVARYDMHADPAAKHAARDATTCADFAGQRKSTDQLRAVCKEHGAKWRAISFAFVFYILATNLFVKAATMKYVPNYRYACCNLSF